MFTDRCSIEARPMLNRMIFQCDCFARFAVVHRHLADDYESSSHSKAEVQNVIGEKELAVLKTDCLGTNQGVGLIACSVIIDTNLRGLARVENVERNGEFE